MHQEQPKAYLEHIRTSKIPLGTNNIDKKQKHELVLIRNFEDFCHPPNKFVKGLLLHQRLPVT